MVSCLLKPVPANISNNLRFHEGLEKRKKGKRQKKKVGCREKAVPNRVHKKKKKKKTCRTCAYGKGRRGLREDRDGGN